MARPAIRPRSKTKASAPAVPLALLRVDGTRVRHQIKREYEKVVRDLEKARREIEHHEKVDLPEFNRWLHRKFGALLTAIRETSARLEQQRFLLLEVESEILFYGGSARRAFARVMHRREHPEAPPENPEGAERDGRNDQGPQGKDPFSGFGFTSEEEPEGFDGFFGFGNRHRRTGPDRAPAPAPAAARIKELYRALARLLHPDAQQEMTPQKREWWHQTQTAYDSGDLEQLEVILSLCEIENSGTTATTSLSILQRISAQLKKTLRKLKGQLTKCRRDPAWKFKDRDDLEPLEEHVRDEMSYDLASLKRQLQGIEAQLAEWATPRQRRQPRQTRTSRPRQATFDPLEFLF